MRPAVRTRFCAMALAACLLAASLLTSVAATSASASPVGEGSSQARTLATRLAALGSPSYLLGNINDTLTRYCLDRGVRFRLQRRLPEGPVPRPRLRRARRHYLCPAARPSSATSPSPWRQWPGCSGASQAPAEFTRAEAAQDARRGRSAPSVGGPAPAPPIRPFLPACPPATRPPGHPATRPPGHPASIAGHRRTVEHCHGHLGSCLHPALGGSVANGGGCLTAAWQRGPLFGTIEQGDSSSRRRREQPCPAGFPRRWPPEPIDPGCHPAPAGTAECL